MRRPISLLVLLLLAAALIAGCGSTKAPATVADPAKEALRYVPAQPALVGRLGLVPASLPARRLDDLVRSVPGGPIAAGRVDSALRDVLGDTLVDLRRVLVTSPIVFAADGPALKAGRLVAVGVGADAASVKSAVEGEVASGEAVPDGGWAKFDLYTVDKGRAHLAVDGATLIAGRDRRDVIAAIDRRSNEAPTLSRAALRRRLGRLDDPGALVDVAFDPQPLIPARYAAIPYVGAIKDVVVAATAEPDGLAVRAHVSADTTDITENDVPIALGPKAPTPMGTAPLVVSLRDIEHTVEWVRRAAEVVAPDTVKKIDDLTNKLRRFARVDPEYDIIGSLTADTTITSDLAGKVTARAEVADPDATSSQITRIRRVAKIGGFAAKLGLVDLGGYGVQSDGDKTTLTKDGNPLATFGVSGDALVVSNDPDVDLEAVADVEGPATLPPDKGALRATLSPAAVQKLLADRLHLPAAIRPFLTPLRGAILTARGEEASLDLELHLPLATQAADTQDPQELQDTVPTDTTTTGTTPTDTTTSPDTTEDPALTP